MSVLNGIQIPDDILEATSYLSGALSQALRHVLEGPAGEVDTSEVRSARKTLAAYDAWHAHLHEINAPTPPLCDHCKGGVEAVEVIWPKPDWVWIHRVSRQYSCANGRTQAEVDGTCNAPAPTPALAFR